LWLGGFFQPDELRVLQRVRASRARPGGPVTAAAETTEFAGEIVATDLPDVSVTARADQERVK
jgi:hypothetical protein